MVGTRVSEVNIVELVQALTPIILGVLATIKIALLRSKSKEVKIINNNMLQELISLKEKAEIVVNNHPDLPELLEKVKNVITALKKYGRSRPPIGFILRFNKWKLKYQAEIALAKELIQILRSILAELDAAEEHKLNAETEQPNDFNGYEGT